MINSNFSYHNQVNARASTADVTALSLACAGGHYDTVAELLQHNADPNVILKVL